MTHTFQLLLMRLKLSFSEAMHDRVDFLIGILGDLLITILSLVTIGIIYNNVSSLGGWTKMGAFLILGFYQVLNSFGNVVLANNLQRLPHQVRYGQLDPLLTQPIDIQINLIRRFNFQESFEGVAGFVIVVFALHALHVPFSITTVTLILGSLVLGTAFLWSLYFLISSLGFWLVRCDNLTNLAGVIQSLARLPANAYGRTAEVVFRSIIPIAVIATLPAEVLTRTAVPTLAVISITSALTLFVLSRLVFMYALNSYSSASS